MLAFYGRKKSVLGPTLSYPQYLRGALMRFPLEISNPHLFIFQPIVWDFLVILMRTCEKILQLQLGYIRELTYHHFTITSPSLALFVCLFTFCGWACNFIH